MRSKTLIVLLWVLVLSGSTLHAHPMGNFSINHHATIRLRTDGASIRYVLDFAEIPTFQMGGETSPERWVSDLEIDADGVKRSLQLNNVKRELSAGAGSLSTMKVVMDLSTTWENEPKEVHFIDRNFPDRIGWKEVVIQSDGSIGFPEGNPYATDRSNGLSNYDPDLLSTAPSVVEATLRVFPTVEAVREAQARQ